MGTVASVHGSVVPDPGAVRSAASSRRPPRLVVFSMGAGAAGRRAALSFSSLCKVWRVRVFLIVITRMTSGAPAASPGLTARFQTARGRRPPTAARAAPSTSPPPERVSTRVSPPCSATSALGGPRRAAAGPRSGRDKGLALAGPLPCRTCPTGPAGSPARRSGAWGMSDLRDYRDWPVYLVYGHSPTHALQPLIAAPPAQRAAHAGRAPRAAARTTPLARATMDMGER